VPLSSTEIFLEVSLRATSKNISRFLSKQKYSYSCKQKFLERIARHCIIYILETVWNFAPILEMIYCQVIVEIIKASHAITNRRI
jgi:hypothetical protein